MTDVERMIFIRIGGTVFFGLVAYILIHFQPFGEVWSPILWLVALFWMLRCLGFKSGSFQESFRDASQAANIYTAVKVNELSKKVDRMEHKHPSSCWRD